VDIYFAKFHGNILSLSENIAKSFRGATFFDSHCIVLPNLVELGPLNSENDLYEEPPEVAAT